jgi:ferredoxin
VVSGDPLFLAFLAQHDDHAWHRAVDRLQSAIHPVDRDATRVWFHLFPLRLQRALEQSSEPVALAQHLRLEGRWRLGDQRDTSHHFLFGHRYWGEVCATVGRGASRPAAPGSLDLAALVHELARDAAGHLSVDVSWVVGITAVALRTLQQVGLSTPAGASEGGPMTLRSEQHPDRVIRRRVKDGAGGLLGLLAGRRRQWTVTFDERRRDGSFPLIATQHLTTAAALDRRDYRAADPRCSEGPIPVQCRACSCGTCWVGVLAGAAALSAVEARERTTIGALGYFASEEAHPPMRLACMAEATGPVTIIIPPWNGQIGARLDRSLANRMADRR